MNIKIKNNCKVLNQKIKLGILFLIIFFFSISTGIVTHAQATSDFLSDVKTGLDVASHSGITTQLAKIKSEDYKSSWDEFGTNIIVDGEASPSLIEHSLTADIVNDLQAQLSYDQADEQYLKLRNTTPEEVMNSENDDGNDLLLQDYFEPHPSLEANSDVNPSALDIPVATDTLDAIFTPDISTEIYTASGTSVIAEASTTIENISREASLTPQENFLPPEGDWTPADINVLKSILNTDNQESNDSTSQTQDNNSTDSSSSTDIQTSINTNSSSDSASSTNTESVSSSNESTH